MQKVIHFLLVSLSLILFGCGVLDKATIEELTEELFAGDGPTLRTSF